MVRFNAFIFNGVAILQNVDIIMLTSTRCLLHHLETIMLTSSTCARGNDIDVTYILSLTG